MPGAHKHHGFAFAQSRGSARGVAAHDVCFMPLCLIRVLKKTKYYVIDGRRGTSGSARHLRGHVDAPTCFWFGERRLWEGYRRRSLMNKLQRGLFALCFDTTCAAFAVRRRLFDLRARIVVGLFGALVACEIVQVFTFTFIYYLFRVYLRWSNIISCWHVFSIVYRISTTTTLLPPTIQTQKSVFKLKHFFKNTWVETYLLLTIATRQFRFRRGQCQRRSATWRRRAWQWMIFSFLISKESNVWFSSRMQRNKKKKRFTCQW